MIPQVKRYLKKEKYESRGHGAEIVFARRATRFMRLRYTEDAVQLEAWAEGEHADAEYEAMLQQIDQVELILLQAEGEEETEAALPEGVKVTKLQYLRKYAGKEFNSNLRFLGIMGYVMLVPLGVLATSNYALLLDAAVLLLMNLGLTVREAERVPNGFRALLDWCYTNVGEKLQRYVKVMGGIYLAFGLIFMSGYAIAVALFFRGDLALAVAALGIAVVGTIITAVNILLTYPLFSFAQLTADIRHIRDHGGMAIAGGKEEKGEEKKTAEGETAPAAPAKSEEAPAAPAPEVPAAEEEDDEFGDLPDL
jgi:hypothetical protein